MPRFRTSLRAVLLLGALTTGFQVGAAEPAPPGNWSTGPSAPAARSEVAVATAGSGSAAAVLDRKLFVMGGEGRVASRNVEAYDLATNSWQEFAPLPTGRYGFGAAVHGGRIITLVGSPHPGGDKSTIVEILAP